VQDRKDGLGSRLRALLNAMVLAEIYDGDFRFSWPMGEFAEDASHDIAPVEAVFSEAFADRHMFGRPLRGAETRFAGLAAFAAAPADAHVTVRVIENNPLARAMPRLKGRLARDAYARAFARIGFSPALAAIVARAHAAPIAPTATAIHLRGGDIVDGRFRFIGRFADKACPAPLAALLAEQADRAGRQVVLFGQERRTLDYVVGRTRGRAVVAADWAGPDVDALGRALFDVVAMSRCAEIVAARSHFSLLAAAIGATGATDPIGAIGGRKALAALEAPVDEALDARSWAFARWAAYRRFGGELTGARRCALLADAAALDPPNPLYPLMQALERAGARGPAEGVEDLARAAALLDAMAPQLADWVAAQTPLTPAQTALLADVAACAGAAAGRFAPA
jgi:hypothetical protein